MDKANNVIYLADGTAVSFLNVYFNKEQRVEVRKSYVTTVEKETAKKTFDFYNQNIEEKKSDSIEAPKFDASDIFPNIMPSISNDESTIEEKDIVNEFLNDVKKEEDVTSLKGDVPTAVKEEHVQSDSLPNNGFFNFSSVDVKENTKEEIPVIENNIVSNFDLDSFVSEIPVVEPVAPVAPVKMVQVDDSFEVQNGNVGSEDNSKIEVPSVENENVIELPKVIPSVTPVADENKPLIDIAKPQLMPFVFDASNESNLSAALSTDTGESKNQGAMSIENIEPVREFGADISEQVLESNNVEKVENIPVKTRTLTKKAGFTNSKMLLIITVFFFLSSCAFLVYEIINFVGARAQ